ncbi:MAG: hypothetical protein CDV28_1683 [Candidatus Electronema aureum]|uniref:Uncharacterized protein n=1 Tax=Candidatus Electronema aureum TaxID=2005002 RepID=A0A521FY60_9BACT|nr:MAG: hypothetical protein CDV28_1683 [Candidatus Electronema aureum]
METCRTSLIAFALLAALLSGCDSEVSRLQSENASLRQRLAEAGQRQAELEYMEQQAGIAAGCDWLVSLCPTSIVETGRQAQAQGFGGGHTLPFWIAFITKLLAMGTFLGGMGGMAIWLWIKIGYPEAEELAKAKALLQNADRQAKAAQQRAAQAEAKAVLLCEANWDAQVTLEELNRQIEASKQTLEAKTREIQATKLVQAALNAFD